MTRHGRASPLSYEALFAAVGQPVAPQSVGHGFELRVDNVARSQAKNILRTTGGDESLATAVGLSFRPAAWRGFEIAVQVDNLWDSDFQDVPAVPAGPRQVSGGVNYTW